jgi:hypothetical protein
MQATAPTKRISSDINIQLLRICASTVWTNLPNLPGALARMVNKWLMSRVFAIVVPVVPVAGVPSILSETRPMP